MKILVAEERVVEIEIEFCKVEIHTMELEEAFR